VFLAGFSTDYMMMMPRIAPVFSLYACWRWRWA